MSGLHGIGCGDNEEHHYDDIEVFRSMKYPNQKMIIIIIIMIMILRIRIVVSFKGAIQDFLQSPHCLRTVSNTYAQVAQVQSCATHRVLITCNMLCYVPHDTKGQLSF